MQEELFSVYRVRFESGVSYLVLARSHEEAATAIQVDSGETAEDWKANDSIDSSGVIHPDEWTKITIDGDDGPETLASIVARHVDVTGPEKPEVLCCSEY